MSDFNLLGFLNISVPNEPVTPITAAKENFKILTPSKKADERVSTPKKSPERSLEPLTNIDNGTPNTTKQSPYFRTTYDQAYGSASKSPVPPADEVAPLTPNSVSSEVTVSSTVSQCNDPECDDCLTRKNQEAKKALQEHEKELERVDFENAKKRQQDEIAKEQQKDQEKKDKDRREREADMERLRAERAALRVQKQKEDEEEAAMLKELSKVDHSALDAANVRSREYLGELQVQIEADRARKVAQEELQRNQAPSVLVFGEEEEARQAALQISQKDVMRTLEQQIATKRNEGRAERDAEVVELAKKRAEEEALFQAKKAAEEERARRMKNDMLSSNKDAIEEKKARSEEANAQSRAFDLAQREQNRREGEEEKRKADEKKRAELEALHRQLAEQVQRRREALAKAREDDKFFTPKAAETPKPQLVHCADCHQDLPPERFSNYVVTPSGKVYPRIKAAPKSSPLHKYYHGRRDEAAYDFAHNYS